MFVSSASAKQSTPDKDSLLRLIFITSLSLLLRPSDFKKSSFSKKLAETG